MEPLDLQSGTDSATGGFSRTVSAISETAIHKLTAQMLDVVAVTRITPLQRRALAAAIKVISDAMLIIEPSAIVAPYGSTVFGTALDTSALDVSIFSHPSSVEYVAENLVCALSQPMPSGCFSEAFLWNTTKTRGIMICADWKHRCPDDGVATTIHVRVTFQQYHPVQLAHLMTTYFQQDLNAAHFVVFLKALLRDCHICSAQMNSTALTIAAIGFLWRWRMMATPTHSHLSESPKENLGLLFLEFLFFFRASGEFDPQKSKISVEGITEKPVSQFHTWTVEDAVTGGNAAVNCYRVHEVRQIFEVSLEKVLKRLAPGNESREHIIQYCFPKLQESLMGDGWRTPVGHAAWESSPSPPQPRLRLSTPNVQASQKKPVVAEDPLQNQMIISSRRNGQASG